MNIEKQVQKVSKEGILASQFIFYCCDFIETFMQIAETEFLKAGLRHDKQTESALLRIKYAASDLRKRTTETNTDSQITFGEESDLLKELMLLAIDRTGESDEWIRNEIFAIRQVESKYKLNLRKFGL